MRMQRIRNYAAACLVAVAAQSATAQSPQDAAGDQTAGAAPAAGPSRPTSPQAESGLQAEPREDRTVNFMGLKAAPLTEPLVTDRPDFTESALTVPRGRLQWEMGYTYTSDDEKSVRGNDQTFPEILLRAGLVEDVELRIGWDGWSLTETLTTGPNRAGRRVTAKDHEDGAADMSLGAKFHLLEQTGWQPEFAVLAELGLPSGSGNKSAGEVEPKAGLLWSYGLTDWFTLSGNVNFAVPNGDFGQFLQTSASLSSGFTLSDRVGLYTEYFGFYNNDRHSDAAHYVNGGVTYLIHDNLQLDIRAGFGLNEEADDFFAGAGLAWRL